MRAWKRPNAGAAVAAALALVASAPAPAAPEEISVHVDPRVELMSIIFRLAGNPEYNQPNSASPYAEEVETRFGPFRDHAVVKTARRLRRERGVSYDAVMSMAVHLDDTRSLQPRLPLDAAPARLDQRWRPDDARAFLADARDFVQVTGFNAFVGDHRAFYEAAAARLRAPVEANAYVAWFDAFFGARGAARFHAIPGLLNGGGNYGVGIRFPDGAEEITPVIGVWEFDAEGLPVYGKGVAGTIVHELCHSYTNPFVDAFEDELAPAGRRIYPHCADVMRRQAYGNWKTMMYESLVRACTVRYHLDADGPEGGRRAIEYQHGRGFAWIGEMSTLLATYEGDRDRYPTFDAFMPQVVAFFDGYAARYEDAMERAPKVVSMVPANGATDADPGLATITITFDRSMHDGSWSVVGGGDDFPELTGTPSYDKSRSVLTIPVALKPGWTYRFWLNSDRYQAFRSADGVPLAPVAVTFTTRAAPP